VEFYYNPRSAPPHIQDKFSWNGEGMTDKNFLRSDLDAQTFKEYGDTGRTGVRCFYTTLSLTRDQIKRKGQWADTVPIVKTANYKESLNQPGQDTIVIPTLKTIPTNGAAAGRR